MTIVFIVGMTAMFFAIGVMHKRQSDLEDRVRFTEKWAAAYKKAAKAVRRKKA